MTRLQTVATLLAQLRRADERLSAGFDRAFGAALNPWRHLGALAFFVLVIAVGSGIVAFVLYDTSVVGAYASGRRLERELPGFGPLLRGWHRYSADAFMLLSVLHLLREAVRGHYARFRWYSWITGVPLLWLLWIAGLTGFWLLWDARALYSITATAEWLQALPIASDQLVRNFLTDAALTDRFFSLVVFMHVSLPLFVLAGVWVHIQKISHVRIWPPRSLMLGTLLAFTVLSFVHPAVSLEPARAGEVPATVSLDWFYLFLHPLVDELSATGTWALALLATALLCALPFLPLPTPRAKPQAAMVDLANCNGCGRCVVDCPFGAVIMVARTDRLRHTQQAQVIADQCASCGICVGSCPSSTPFRRMEDIVSGIELPDRPVVDLRRELQVRVQALNGPAPHLLLVSCGQARDWQEMADAGTAVLPMECAGMLPPSFVEYALRFGAQGVVVAGCRGCDCEFRLGDTWLSARLDGAREPRLRTAVPRDCVETVWAGTDQAMVEAACTQLRARLTAPAHDSKTIALAHATSDS